MSQVESENWSDDPSALQDLSVGDKERLAAILDQYLVAREEGRPLDPAALIGEHPELGDVLASYLASIDRLHEVIGSAGTTRGSPSLPVAGTDERRLGDFQLVREIGRGGMGVVFEARQQSLDRQVALKVLPFASVLDSRQLARFRNEAQAAAHLQHSNIVPVFAIGCDQGVHYYAMQYIAGCSLDLALEQVRNLRQERREGRRTAKDPVPEGSSLLARQWGDRDEYVRTVVRIGLEAARALHAAHEQGMVHRDVKPSNLLLDVDGKIWVTDFGLARWQLNANLTRTGDVVGTLRYMSPEQALGQLVDHRSDLYSLGATLYELLALQPAFPQDDPQLLLASVKLGEPRALSSLRSGLSPELVAVIARAMSPKPSDRYESARHLAEDLQNVLQGKPTVARPLRAFDRGFAWMNRHQRAVLAATAGSLFLVLTFGSASLLFLHEKGIAQKNHQRAERHFRDALGALDHLGGQVAERLTGIPDAQLVRQQLLHETLAYYRQFVDRASEDAGSRLDLAMTQGKIGRLCEELGRFDEGMRAHEASVRLFGELIREQPGNLNLARNHALCLNNLALGLSRIGKNAEADGLFRQAIDEQSRILRNHAEDSQVISDLAVSHTNLGLLLAETGNRDGAESELQTAIGLQKRLLESRPDEPEYLQGLARIHSGLAGIQLARSPQESVEHWTKSIAYQRAALEEREAGPKERMELALGNSNLGAALLRSGNTSAAIETIQLAVEIQEHLVSEFPTVPDYQRDLAVTYNNLGRAQHASQDLKAEVSFRRSIEILEKLAEKSRNDALLASQLGGSCSNLGMFLKSQNRRQEAIVYLGRAVDHQRLATTLAPGVPRYRAMLAKHHEDLNRLSRQSTTTDTSMKGPPPLFDQP